MRRMSFRRFVALLALAFAAWLWRAATHEFSGTFLAALSLLLAPIIGLLALAVLVFNLRTFGPPRQDSSRRPAADHDGADDRR